MSSLEAKPVDEYPCESTLAEALVPTTTTSTNATARAKKSSSGIILKEMRWGGSLCGPRGRPQKVELGEKPEIYCPLAPTNAFLTVRLNPMSESTPTLRQIARSLGLSHTTVSEALRGSPRVKPATRDRVLAAAKKAGYRRNPLAGAMMSELRRSRMDTFRGVLGLLDLDGPAARNEGSNRYHHELADGARDRAEELGFKADLFALGDGTMSRSRLDTILQSRGIGGLLLLPTRETPDLDGLDLGRYAAVYTDYVMKEPALHACCPDHYMAMMSLVPRLQSLGYSRLGLVLDKDHDVRLLHRWEAAFRVCISQHPELAKTEPLISNTFDESTFTTWFKQVKPDVVLCHSTRVIEWMTNCGASIPQTHGFCALNKTVNTVPCAGLDFHPRLIGERAVELLTGQMLHNEYGPPKVASISTIVPEWVDGPTVRNLKTRQAGKTISRRRRT